MMPFIPDVVKGRKNHDKSDSDRRKLQRDIELEDDCTRVFNINMKHVFLASIAGLILALTDFSFPGGLSC